MSLQVWLPLNRELHNQGLLGNSVFNGNAIVNDNGKIGKCYSFDGLNSYLIADFKPGEIVPNEMSFCCWVKLNEINRTQTLFSSRKTTGAGLTIFILSNNQLRFDNGNDTNTSTNQTTFSYNNFMIDIWYHVTVVQTNTQKKLYINGVLQQSINKASANLGSNSATKCTIGASGSNNATGNWLNGYLNDVRIYDHALSDKEVEEIAKGLVLHYKLDNSGIKNILTSSSSKTRTIASGETSGYTGYWGLEPLFHDFIVKGTVLTVEYDYSISGVTTTTAQLYSQFNTSIIFPSQRLYYDSDNPVGHKIDTFIVTEDQANYDNTFRFRIRLQYVNEGASFTISNIKMYFGNPTNIIYDSSGYGNNGIITGSLETVVPSPRYNCATFISNGATNYIKSSILQLPGDQITMNYWFKSSNTLPGKGYHTPMNSYTKQAYQMSIHKTGLLYAGLLVDGDRTIIAGTSTKLLDGEWHMCSMTYNGTIIKLYVDGVMEKSTLVSGTLNTSQSFIFGHYGSDTSYYCIDTAISDARIYTTALTFEQIKELYSTSMTIDNQGNIHVRELVE